MNKFKNLYDYNYIYNLLKDFDKNNKFLFYDNFNWYINIIEENLKNITKYIFYYDLLDEFEKENKF